MKATCRTLRTALTLAVGTCLPINVTTAQNNVLSYQGRVQSGGTNFTGLGQFKFALVTVTNEAIQATAVATISGGFLTILAPVEIGSGYGIAPAVAIMGGGGSGAAATANVSAGTVVSYTVISPGSGYSSLPTVIVAPPPADLDYTTYWSNDGSSVDGSAPEKSVNVQVQNGLFTVRLGDDSLPNMQRFAVGLFQQPNLQLRTWFDDGVHGFGVIDSTHRLAAVPYAFTANFASKAELASTAAAITGPVAVGQLSGLIATDQIAAQAITSSKIRDGGISPEKLGPILLNDTFWRLNGNADTTGNVDFIGTTDSKPFDLRVNNLRGLRLEDNGDSAEDDDTITDEAPNLVGGSRWNKVGSAVAGAIIAGGGATNGIYTYTSPLPPYGELSVVFSRSNAVYADFGSILGGFGNQILEDSIASKIGGGSGNKINSSSRSTIGGGIGNIISNLPYATIAGGYGNTIAGEAGAIGGGVGNTVSGRFGAIGGGSNNRTAASVRYATVPGGTGNEAGGEASTVGGGEDNTSSGTAAVVAGGRENNAEGGYSTVGGGRNNEADGHYSFVGGGSNNVVSSGFAAIGGGLKNSASAAYSVVAGGEHNVTTGTSASVLGGLDNTASGAYSVVMGGRDNWAEGNYSFAGGRNTRAFGNGSFVWGDSTSVSTLLSVNNSFWVRASGGVQFYTQPDLSSGVSLAGGGTAWTTICDRAAKKNFEPLDCLAVLNRLMEVPLQRWNYSWEDESRTQHIGPMAQDFKAAFYPGRDDKGITTLEFDGVALAAIQGLNQKLTAELAQKDIELTGLKQRLEKLEQLMNERSGGSR